MWAIVKPFIRVTVSYFKTSTSTPFYLSSISLSVHTKFPFFYSLKLLSIIAFSLGSASRIIESSKYFGGGAIFLYSYLESTNDFGATAWVSESMYGLFFSSSSLTSSIA